MKIVIAGGTGQVGALLQRHFTQNGHEVVLVSRSPSKSTASVQWDGKTTGPWCSVIDGSDVVINLAGRSVNCRYTKENLAAMLNSRVDSTRVMGQAIAQSQKPPALWLQMSTATIYAHRFDAPNDEYTGIIGGNEPDVPKYWGFSVKIAQEWERELEQANTPNTRKVAMRTSMVMSPDDDGVFDVLFGLVRKRLGGVSGNGKQYVSWIHDTDLVNAVQFVVDHQDLSGAINFASPNPIPQREFMAILRQNANISVGLPATKWMLEVGAFFLRTDTELLLKSRRVIPTRLQQAGFSFAFPTWEAASQDLVNRWRANHH